MSIKYQDPNGTFTVHQFNDNEVLVNKSDQENKETREMRQIIEQICDQQDLIRDYQTGDKQIYNELVLKYPEYKNIDLFIKIATQTFNKYKKRVDSEFHARGDKFFPKITCHFKGCNEDPDDNLVYITATDNSNIHKYPYLHYDHNCSLYITEPQDFGDNPQKYKENFIEEAVMAIAENYKRGCDEDAKGLTGQSIPNPHYIKS